MVTDTKINHAASNENVHTRVTHRKEKPSISVQFKQWFHMKQRYKKSTEAVSPLRLFRYTTVTDVLYLSLAIVCSAIFGLVEPLFLVIFGNSIDSFTRQKTDLCSWNFTYLTEAHCPSGIVLTTSNFHTTMSLCNFTGSNLTNVNYDFKDQTREQTTYLIIISCVGFICSYMRTTLFIITAERQACTTRQTLFQSLMRKDIVFFDTHKTGELSLLLSDDINKIRDGIGDKFGALVHTFATVVSSVVIGFIKGWKLALVILSTFPVILTSFIVTSMAITNLSAMESKAYGRAGIIAEEVISSIRTVLSYNGQAKELRRYEQSLDNAKQSAIKKNIINGLTMATQLLVVYSLFGLGFWYGAKLIREENYTIGLVYTIFLTIFNAIFTLQHITPQFQALTQAQVAAYRVQQVIDEPFKIQKISEAGTRKDNLTGHIRFSNVNFSYPSRQDVSILTNLSFEVQHGQTVALVGSSGSGKSTCVQLLQRFYDLDSGSICIDEQNINDYNLNWLRQQLGVVSQEPVLFHTTIHQNIRFGRMTATDEEIFEAGKMANAHEFIMNLPDKYETLVGERGVALSGGQKQRIAIARALLANPKILLLDEATSALDNESEKIVQDALDRAARGRTTLIIAHRLSTIRNADKIIVLAKGKIAEEGDHDSLMKIHGVYYNLVQQQSLLRSEEEQLEFEDKPTTINGSNIRIERIPSVVNTKSSSALDISCEKIDTRTNGDEKKVQNPSIIMTILRMNKPEWKLIIIGCLAALFTGTVGPSFAIIRTKMTVLFQECDRDVIDGQILLYILLFVGLGFISFIFHTMQSVMFAYSGELLTKRLRSQAFRAILRQDMTYFDQSTHSTGALCTRLATEASAVQGASGVHLGFLCQTLMSLGMGLLIGFLFSWQLTLLMIAFIPFVILGAYFQMRVTAVFEDKNKPLVDQTGKITVEVLQNIRTVLQLGKERYFHDEYAHLLDTIYRSTVKRAHLSALCASISITSSNFASAALLALSSALFNQAKITFEAMYMVYNSVANMTDAASQALMLSPDYGRAVEAAEKIVELLNRKPMIDNESTGGDQIPDFIGQLHFDDINFVYPGRPESVVLKNFNFHIKAGQKVAFVGTSGCGKSTTIQLIERFYDTNAGRLLVDAKDIRSLDLQWYRSQIGIVSQEPTLFDRSIRENIAYGDNTREDVSLDEIIQAAKTANIHDFVQNLPQGYETMCGAKGIHLSGGQKQRIAIARALLRNPKIMLLDEATSALDSESEKLVQEALDRALQNRTSIIIAHRLSTIRNVDMICVIHDGRIVEQGTHDELLAHGDVGHYYRMIQRKQT